MKDLDLVLGGVGPEVELDDPDAVEEGLNDGPLAAAAAQLVPRQVRVVARVDEVVRQRPTHVLVHLHHSFHLEQNGTEEMANYVLFCFLKKGKYSIDMDAHKYTLFF